MQSMKAEASWTGAPSCAHTSPGSIVRALAVDTALHHPQQLHHIAVFVSIQPSLKTILVPSATDTINQWFYKR